MVLTVNAICFWFISSRIITYNRVYYVPEEVG